MVPTTLVLVFWVLLGACQSGPAFRSEAGCSVHPCPWSDSPVCASDGQTYQNQCTLDNYICIASQEGKQLYKVHDGSCSSVSGSVAPSPDCEVHPCPLPPHGEGQVCASDGQTYQSDCELDVSACLMAQEGKEAPVKVHDGPCVSDILQKRLVSPDCEVHPCPPPLPDGQVCASDGQTYQSDCVLEVSACLMVQNGQEAPLKVHNGSCDDCDVPPCPLPLPEEVICASDGVTYQSNCILQVAACRLALKGQEAPLKLHDGPCESATQHVEFQLQASPDCLVHPCPIEPHAEICASDGQTYQSDCVFEVSSCLMAQHGEEAPLKVHDGPCESAIIPPEAQPHPDCLVHPCPGTIDDERVCASDGKTYHSDCDLDVTVCVMAMQGEEAPIKVHDGPCESATPRQWIGVELRLAAKLVDSAVQGDGIDYCDPDYVCSKEFNPICGVDGNTYGNRCFFEKARCFWALAGMNLYAVGEEGWTCAELAQMWATGAPITGYALALD
ncbi:PREDICTED: agrin-like [Branchiostoma belcheri]|uniref:Agrin-like n=1 Tax=Branchiostoma belcheri TaxID=7741 RepID=A0A6P5A060_BRABE|nr:PREDICTED: agrin-like [Branchiostoma belcheri]